MKDFEAQREELIETAAERESFYWQGKKLEPFSFGRQAAAQRIGAEGASTIENAVLLVYLCTLTPNEIDRVRGEDEIKAFRARMNEWADSQGVTLADRGPVTEVANQIWGEMAASRFKLAAKKEAGKTEAAPPNG